MNWPRFLGAFFIAFPVWVIASKATPPETLVADQALLALVLIAAAILSGMKDKP